MYTGNLKKTKEKEIRAPNNGFFYVQNIKPPVKQIFLNLI